MKVIHVAGFSGSGKTSFIRQLIPELLNLGPVATVKHIGHHLFTLDEGKDTTTLLREGAGISAGIDSEKTVLISRSILLEPVLEQFCDAGIRYAVIEGFKSLPTPKIVIGGLDDQRCLMRDPQPSDVVKSLPDFPDMYTLAGSVRELRSDHSDRMDDPGVIASQWKVSFDEQVPTGVIQQKIQDSIQQGDALPVCVRLHRNLFSGPDSLIIIVSAADPAECQRAIFQGLEAAGRLGIRTINGRESE